MKKHKGLLDVSQEIEAYRKHDNMVYRCNAFMKYIKSATPKDQEDIAYMLTREHRRKYKHEWKWILDYNVIILVHPFSGNIAFRCGINCIPPPSDKIIYTYTWDRTGNGDCLTIDIMRHIMKQLDYKSLCACRTVSRKFRRASKYPSLWKPFWNRQCDSTNCHDMLPEYPIYMRLRIARCDWPEMPSSDVFFGFLHTHEKYLKYICYLCHRATHYSGLDMNVCIVNREKSPFTLRGPRGTSTVWEAKVKFTHKTGEIYCFITERDRLYVVDSSVYRCCSEEFTLIRIKSSAMWPTLDV